MWIKSVNLLNFRNYSKQTIELEKDINIIYGENAQGKTNIIEAIYLSAIGKSFRTNKDKELIKEDEKNSIIEIEYIKKDREGKIKIEINDKKNIYVNGIKIKKLSELLGKLNIVIFNPDDINILKGSPQNRRRFVDVMISQLRPNYLHILSLYGKVLEERNALLRILRDDRKQIQVLDILDEKLAEYALKIYEYRKEFFDKIDQYIKVIHLEITDQKEDIVLKYLSECFNKEKYIKTLNERRNLDIIKGFTSKGIHRDDFMIYINGKELSIYGSQGQNRTVILSLKLSELSIIKEEIGEYPILLLDDFMSELDEKRRKNLIEKVDKSQVIITCTDKFHVENKQNLIYNVKDGQVYENIKIQ